MVGVVAVVAACEVQAESIEYKVRAEANGQSVGSSMAAMPILRSSTKFSMR